ncbi:uncharacterized protein [Spinacia oleracea]|uniref:Kinesin motor domain-containing protein n=1 Tax=Spinacia oleracea TaxID=3562 RepID=A0ABM3RLG8_SPIOL|nr:uncharacterized protein LOC110788363 [Spinacia oleracea]
MNKWVGSKHTLVKATIHFSQNMTGILHYEGLKALYVRLWCDQQWEDSHNAWRSEIPWNHTFGCEGYFGIIQETPSREFLLRVSYIEIYNEVFNNLREQPFTTVGINEVRDKLTNFIISDYL